MYCLHVELDDMVARWKDDWRSTGRSGYAIGLGVGVSYGPATVDLMGSTGKKQFGVVGEPINMAAFLGSRAVAGTVLIDAGSFERSGAALPGERLTRLRSPKHHQRIDAVSVRHGRTRAARRTIGRRLSESFGTGTEDIE